MDLFFMQLFNALSVSSILLLASLGLAITFGLMGVINMAHGEFIMIGAYATYVVQNIWKQIFPEAMFDWYFPAAILVSFLFTALLGVLLERVIICRLYGRALDSLLVTWGISLVLQQLVRSVFGPANVSVSCPSFLDKNIHIFGMFSMSCKRLLLRPGGCVLCTHWVSHVPDQTGAEYQSCHAEPPHGSQPWRKYSSLRYDDLCCRLRICRGGGMCHYISGQYRAYCGAVLHCRQFYDCGSRRCGKNRGLHYRLRCHWRGRACV